MGSDKAIMLLYCNKNKYDRGIQLRDDVLTLIILYVGKLNDENCAVYISGNGRLWKPVDSFREKNIIKIDSGKDHSLSLDDDGRLWSFGNNRYKQCGHSKGRYIKNAKEI